MKSFIFLSLSLSIAFLLFLFAGCGLYKSDSVINQAFDDLDNSILVQNHNPNFPLKEIPESIEDKKERAIYLSKYYWELFPFEDTTLINQPEVTEQGFVDYIHLLNYIPFKHANRSIKYLFVKAQADSSMYAHFASLFEKYYYNADSPFRNEELYIPVLETILKTGKLSETDYEKYDFQKDMIHKNRVGTKAANFVYTLPSGDWKRLHALKSNYVILFFSDPQCPNCIEVANGINDSEILKRVCSRNSFSRTMLCVLNIYPKSNTPLWQESLSFMPQENWIHAYDKAKVLINKRVYNLKTLPTIYLLDKDKRIILKETSLDEIESFFLSKE